MGTSSSRPQRPGPTRGLAATSTSSSSSHIAPSPSFFSFQQGSETTQNIRYGTESSPLLGRYRAVPPRPSDRHHGGRARSGSQLGLLSAGFRGSVHVGYGAVVLASMETAAADADSQDSESDEDELHSREEGGLHLFMWRMRRLMRRIDEIWVNPKAAAVSKLVDVWWSRWAVLVLLPAALVRCSPRPSCPACADADQLTVNEYLST